MSVNKFRPEIWSALLLQALRKQLVYNVFTNNDYEGDIAEAGDTVRITTVGRPTIGTYVPNVTVITPEAPKESQRTLVVDQSKFFAVEVDDVDARQAKGNIMPTLTDEAGFGFADVIDQYIASFYTAIQSANQLGSIGVNSATTPTDAYDKVLVPLRVKLDKANVPNKGRNAVITPEMHGCLLRDQRFVSFGTGDNLATLEEGIVGRAAGFTISLSNNTPNTTGQEFAVVAGTNRAITFANQINKMEAYRPQSAFADAVKGLVLYGAKNVRPDSLASALVTVS